MTENAGIAPSECGTERDSFANEARFADQSLTIDVLARMPEYRRNLYLRCGAVQGVDQAALKRAVEREIQHEVEARRGKIINRKIYFVQAATGQIKIGVTADLRKRMRGLKGASPVPLELLFAFDGGILGEIKLHNKFRAHRLHGEWFAPHPDILAEIARLQENTDG